MNWREFKPTIFFLAKFIGMYIVANLLYGWYITAYQPQPDPLTQWVTEQSAWILSHTGWRTIVVDHPTKPTTTIFYHAKAIVSVYEGCNGLNVIIIFLSFLFAFGPIKKSLGWFAALGILIIYVCNLLRIILLFFVTLYLPHFHYFMHKYLFTAIIYAVVFAMWLYWVKRHSLKSIEHT